MIAEIINLKVFAYITISKTTTALRILLLLFFTYPTALA
ncbi:hypothetical protein EMIT079MI2_160016 [Bacillus sp. IT-79MI2]